MVNDLFRSKGSVANCMTDRAPGDTGNVSEQFLHRNRTLILVHNVPEQLLKRSKTYPVQCEHSLKIQSKGSVANCMTDRAPVDTGNVSEQFLHRNRTLILVHNVPEQLLKRSKTYPVQCEHSLKIQSNVCFQCWHGNEVISSQHLVADDTYIELSFYRI